MATLSSSNAMKPGSQRALVAIVTLLVIAAGLHGGSAAKDLDEPQNPLGCVCSDVDPRDDFTKVNVPYTCWQQSNFVGVCGQPFIMQTPEEVPEGYCQISCGRCDCCSTFATILQSKAPVFLWMLNLTQFGPWVTKPGFMATMLVPTDEAVWRLLHQLGYQTKQDVEGSSTAKAQVTAIVGLHVIPPTDDISALWTTPFMRNSAQIHTFSSAYLTADMWQGKVKITGPKNEAWIYDKDIPVCKGYIDMIDTALIPA